MLINPHFKDFNFSGDKIKAAVKNKLRKGAKRTKAALAEFADCYMAGCDPYAAEARMLRKQREKSEGNHSGY